MYASSAYVWAKVLIYLEERLTSTIVTATFDDAEVVELTNEHLIIYSPSEFRRGTILNRYAVLIQDALNKLAVGRTTFAMAHRLSTLRNADKILVLDHGNVVEFGTHLELLNSRGHYYKLVMAQKKAAESGVEAED